MVPPNKRSLPLVSSHQELTLCLKTCPLLHKTCPLLFKTVSVEVAHFTFLFSRFYFLRQKVVSKSDMKPLCDVDVWYIVGKVSKRCFFIVAYDFHQNLHRPCANASFFTILWEWRVTDRRNVQLLSKQSYVSRSTLPHELFDLRFLFCT